MEYVTDAPMFPFLTLQEDSSGFPDTVDSYTLTEKLEIVEANDNIGKLLIRQANIGQPSAISADMTVFVMFYPKNRSYSGCLKLLQ